MSTKLVVFNGVFEMHGQELGVTITFAVDHGDGPL
jgi:hypothetical protein